MVDSNHFLVYTITYTVRNGHNMWTEKTISIGEIKNLLESGYEIEVDSPDGWVGVNFFIDKGNYQEHILIMEDPSLNNVRCNADHLFETALGWVSAKELVGKGEVNVLTRSGYAKGRVVNTENIIPIVDINVEHENHRYYTEDVSSHNTGVGKTLFMTHCASSMLMSGKNVLYITMEMAEERIAERIDANLLDVTLDDLRFLLKGNYQNKISKVKARTTGKLIVKEYPTGSASANHFRHLLNELKLKKNFAPDVIFIDYLNICMSARLKHGANINSYTLIKAIAEELRGLAMEFNVPVMTATQTTRSGYGNSDVEITDTSESFGLPATADFMFALISTEDLEKLGQLMVKQLKNRWGSIDSPKRFIIGVDRAKMKLFDAEESAQNGITGGSKQIEQEDRPLFDSSEMMQDDDFEPKKLGSFKKKKPNFGGFN
jgi:hypothetical protein